MTRLSLLALEESPLKESGSLLANGLLGVWVLQLMFATMGGAC